MMREFELRITNETEMQLKSQPSTQAGHRFFSILGGGSRHSQVQIFPQKASQKMED